MEASTLDLARRYMVAPMSSELGTYGASGASASSRAYRALVNGAGSHAAAREAIEQAKALDARRPTATQASFWVRYERATVSTNGINALPARIKGEWVWVLALGVVAHIGQVDIIGAAQTA